jgi:hypothetical protein
MCFQGAGTTAVDAAAGLVYVALSHCAGGDNFTLFTVDGAASRRR